MTVVRERGGRAHQGLQIFSVMEKWEKKVRKKGKVTLIRRKANNNSNKKNRKTE